MYNKILLRRIECNTMTDNFLCHQIKIEVRHWVEEIICIIYVVMVHEWGKHWSRVKQGLCQNKHMSYHFKLIRLS